MKKAGIRALCLVLSIATIVPAMVGCKKTTATSSGSSGGPVTIHIMNRVNAQVSFDNNAWLQAVDKAANVDLVIDAPPINNYVDRLQIVMASGDIPDVVYNWGADDARIRPFAFGGVGATNYSFGDLLIPGAPAGKIPGDTRFSTTWGAGVKLYPTKNLGFRATVQWTPTYIKSTDVGYWCDPFYGCWVAGNPDYSHQFDTSGGVTFRF